ncbi:MAG: hypothetical protein AVO39_00545 [delta proteobacterium MLS_D]|jgi:spermidine synthase|nr:MAG: hypothetical protein AVO39_00545 [delta proteobacterium MLS_D]
MKILIPGFFFFSGMTGLVYQIIWMRLISQVIGGAPFAVAATLVAFMSGLGLGSYIAARTIDRFQGPKLVRIYGFLELAVGIYALGVPLLLMLLQIPCGVLYNNLYEHILAYNFFIFVGTLLVLVVPTTCMGATLPILCKYSVDSLSRLGSNAGLLYGINTFGAALGALLCGFWMINVMGVWGSMLAAVAVNCAIGVTCLALAPREKNGRPEKTTGSSEVNGKVTETIDGLYSPAVLYCALAIFMVSGFCAMAYEVFWTKLLGLLIGPTTYSFTIVLVTFIAGLALGNLAFGRWADRTKNVPALLIVSQTAAAFFALFVSQFFGNSQLFFVKLIHAFSDHFTVFFIIKALTLFGFMILPTFFLGATFPLVAKIYTRSLSTVGRSIGVAYAMNTIGAVLGSFCTGFILIPMVGKETGISLVIALQMAVSLGAGLVLILKQGERLWRAATLAIIFVAGLTLCTIYPSWNRHILARGKYHRFGGADGITELAESTGWVRAALSGADILAALERGELVYYGDGIGGFTTVLKYPGPFGEAEYSMANSGKMDASSRGDMKTQTLLAHFPMLFAKNPGNVMILGLASGITVGEVLHYPVQQVDVVDINDRVFEAARFFDLWNNNVLDDPRTRPIVQDGLAHLVLTRTTYDVIISEPSNPWMAGQASLFTREFFEAARKKLNDDGICVQWFHCYQMDWDTFTLVGRTFADVFPDSLLISCEPGGLSGDFLFVGFKSGNGPDWKQARHNISYARHSHNIDLAYPELLYRLIVSENLDEVFGQGPVNRENRPLLEYAAPRLMYRNGDVQMALLRRLLEHSRLSSDTRSHRQVLFESVDARIDYAAYALSVYTPFANMVDLSRADRNQRERYRALLEEYSSRNPLDFNILRDSTLARELRQIQITSIKEMLPSMEQKAPAHFYLGWCLAEEGELEEAIVHYRKGIQGEPFNTQSLNDLGCLLYKAGKHDEALEYLERALALRPRFLRALGNSAYVYLAKGQDEKALHYFLEVLRVEPDSAEAHYQAGHIEVRLGNPVDAAAHLRQAIRLEPGMAEAHDSLALVLATERQVFDPRWSLYHARQASKLTGAKNPEILATLARAYRESGYESRARQTAERALELARESGRTDLLSLIENRLGSGVKREP